MKRSVFLPSPRVGLSLGISLALAACAAVGPNFTEPAAPRTAADRPYTPEVLPTQTVATAVAGGEAQQLAFGKDMPAQWWSVFQSEPLDRLIRAALTRSPSLAAAQAALRQAQESYNAQYGSTRFPAVTGQLGAERERTVVAPYPPSVFNLYNASVNVSYTVDAFGAVRRGLENLQATIDYQRFQVEASYLALTANVVTTAIQEASLRAQLKATRDVLTLQEQALDLIDKQSSFGAIARSVVLTQRTQVAQTRATIPPLEKALAQTRYQLSVYAGQLPGEGGLPEFTLDSLKLPGELPVSLPSSLVRQRPDIRASEALLHAASAQVGVATANLYPQINLSGSFGVGTTQFPQLVNGNSILWNLIGGVTTPIFNGGALDARRRGAIAAYDQSMAQYQSTVLGAFQNVANSLRALESDAITLKAQADAAGLARESLDLTDRQFKLGAVNYLSLLDAQRTYQQTQVSLVQAQAARYADTAALFQSLGGGWWNRGPLADANPSDLGGAQQ